MTLPHFEKLYGEYGAAMEKQVEVSWCEPSGFPYSLEGVILRSGCEEQKLSEGIGTYRKVKESREK